MKRNFGTLDLSVTVTVMVTAYVIVCVCIEPVSFEGSGSSAPFRLPLSLVLTSNESNVLRLVLLPGDFVALSYIKSVPYENLTLTKSVGRAILGAERQQDR